MRTKISLTNLAASFVVGVVVLLGGASFAQAQAAAQRPTLDYEFFKARVQPIFLKRRSPDHARCYACHEKTKHAQGLSLESLSPGATTWNEEQSRANFAAVSRVTTPGNPAQSMFPFHPLAPEAGGDGASTHAGGRQFETKDDPDYKTIVEWINGAKAAGR
jgi:hypothetical protein